MKRKTNLFYLSGDDSKFITFSNYSESLTGNFIATDWKMFPSRFICMYIKELDTVENFEEKKSAFIKYLVAYYENKMAFLRDKCLENNLNIEKTLMPLNYLLESIYRLSGARYDESSKSFKNLLMYYDIKNIKNNDDVNISFIGDITEQDYNGIYSDIISVINNNDVCLGDIITNDVESTVIKYDINNRYLYGWSLNDEYIGISDYKNVNPIFDNNDNYNKYYTNSDISGLSLEPNEGKNIKFNIIIPLYDLVNININNVNDTEDFEQLKEISLSDNTESYIKNMPLGIWFSEEVIELKRDNKTGYAPSWSLLLSAQFKPFPYSQKMPNEITQDSTKEAFATYSQVLIRQNRILEKFEELEKRISNIEQGLVNINGKLNTVGTAYYMDNMNTEMINYENFQNNKFNNFKEEIYAYINNTWKGFIA